MIQHVKTTRIIIILQLIAVTKIKLIIMRQELVLQPIWMIVNLPIHSSMMSTEMILLSKSIIQSLVSQRILTLTRRGPIPCLTMARRITILTERIQSRKLVHLPRKSILKKIKKMLQKQKFKKQVRNNKKAQKKFSTN